MCVDEWIYSRCTAGWDVAGDHRYRQKSGNGKAENLRIGGEYQVEQRLQITCTRNRSPQIEPLC
jgi:hypothetical protein